METISPKVHFLEENKDYKELKPSQELATIGDFQDIDEIEDEIWLLQCPKGFDIEAELQGQKLKLPGRTNFNTSETVAVEYAQPESRAFGYCKRKGRYALRLLPVKGNILLRDRLKATDAVSLENAQSSCLPQERMLLPDMIKVRHPLHGHQFDKSLRVDKAITDRLRKADEISAKVLHEALTNRKKGKPEKKLSMAAENDDDDVTFVREIKGMKLKRKRKHSESNTSDRHISEGATLKKKKSHKPGSKGDEVSTDFQWIKNL